MKTVRTLVLALACSGLAATASAQKMSPGLWEVTMDMKGQGGEMEAGMAKMQAELSKMTPDQRKQMESMMSSRGMSMGGGGMPGGPGGPAGMSVKTCVSKESAERGEPPEDPQHNCKRDGLSRSGNTVKFKLVCSNPPSTGEGEYTLVSDKAFTGKVTMVSQGSAKTGQMEVKQSGRWLAADCGGLKPVAPAR
jgi:hypothetical protein